MTQFDVEPGYVEQQDRDGNLRRFKIRVSKILGLTNDLALALAAAPIRIEAPVPGRAVVGIEVPNTVKSMVGLQGMLTSPQFRQGKGDNCVSPWGRDVSGEPVIAGPGRHASSAPRRHYGLRQKCLPERHHRLLAFL